jgi:tRNA threonylcarbamoyladenosine biosynthesis protein TsaE
MTLSIEERCEFLADADATVLAGARLARGLHGGMIVTLSGDLGAGKTTFVRGILRGLGWSGAVKSPSYVLLEHYQISSLYFYHFDFYRFEDSSEWETTGFSDYFRPDAVCAIEWPERIAALLPIVDLSLRLDNAEPGRKLRVRASTVAGSACLGTFARSSE